MFKMKFKFFSIFFIILLLFSYCSKSSLIAEGNKNSDETKLDFTRPSTQVLSPEKPGNLEKTHAGLRKILSYDIKWLGFHIGEAQLSISEIKQTGSNPIRVLEASVHTNNFLSKIYPVRDKYISHIDLARLCSIEYEISRREGRYRKDAVTIFDQDEHKAYFENFLDNSKKEFSIPSDAQDPLSALYCFMQKDIKNVDEITYKIVNNEKIYSIFVDIKKELLLNFKGKKILVYEVVPYAIIDDKRVSGGNLVCFVMKDTSVPIRAILKGPIFTKIELIQKNISASAMKEAL